MRPDQLEHFGPVGTNTPTNPLPESAVELAISAAVKAMCEADLAHRGEEALSLEPLDLIAYKQFMRRMARAALPAIREAVKKDYTELLEKAEAERDFLVEEYERAVGCGQQGYLHAAMHLFNAITNARIDAKIALTEQENHLGAQP